MEVLIIGNGIAGSTAARFLRKWSDVSITMISEETTYAFSRTALMYVYMGHLKQSHTNLYPDDFWEKNRISILKQSVSKVDLETKSVIFNDGTHKLYDKLIIATGSKPNKFGWPGENLDGVQGLYHLQDLENMELFSKKGIKRAVIVGGGLIGVEMAEMFHSRNIPVTFLVREEKFWNGVLPSEEADMVGKHIMSHGIDLRLNAELSEIHPDSTNRVTEVSTKSGEKISCDFVGLTVGVSPNIDFLKNSDLTINKGILVNDLLQTNNADVYAIGDCAEVESPREGRKSIEAVWYTGRAMGQYAAANILGKAITYEPGIWFNSAKFFDIEYQVYGTISPTEQENIATFYWQHPKENKSLRIAYDTLSMAVTGFNLLGIRFRQEVCTKWIQDKVVIDEVIENLKVANFDPEFFKMHEDDIILKYNEKYSKKLKSKSNRGLHFVKKLFS